MKTIIKIMKSLIFNKEHKTNPVIIHNPCSDIRESVLWSSLTNEHVNLKKNITLPKDLTIVTWNNKHNSLLEQQLKKLNINYLNLVEVGIDWFSNRIKIHSFIEGFDKIKTKYVLGLDSFDVIIVGELENILEKFKNFNCNLLFNATNFNYPNYATHLNTPEENKNQYFKYLNSGCFIGEKNFIKSVFSECLFLPEELKSQYPQSDQFLLKFLYFDKYPNIRIDSCCEIFQIITIEETEKTIYINKSYL